MSEPRSSLQVPLFPWCIHGAISEVLSHAGSFLKEAPYLRMFAESSKRSAPIATRTKRIGPCTAASRRRHGSWNTMYMRDVRR